MGSTMDGSGKDKGKVSVGGSKGGKAGGDQGEWVEWVYSRGR